VILLTGCNQWDAGMDVVVEGRAARVTDRDTLELLAEAWRRKWDRRWDYQPGHAGFKGAGAESVSVFTVHPDKVFAFAKGNFSHRRHAF
jgi:hypothetical protein